MRKIKIIILYVLKYSGVFHLMRRFNRRKLCILAYHGISQKDENIFQPTLFMTEKFFHHRIAILSLRNYPVIPLDEAVAGLKNNSLPDNAVVITFDDGWEGIFSGAMPILQKHNFPATVYIMSYNVAQRIPVLDVFLRYILWKTPVTTLDLGQLGEQGLSGVMSLRSPEEKEDMFNRLFCYLEQKLPAEAQCNFVERICRKLDLDWDQLQSDRMLRLASPEIIAGCSKISGIDMELHTHHHVFPVDSYENCQQEIRQNQHRLMDWTGKDSRHFCYPSGWYEKKQIGWLKKMAILSATTVKPGLNGCDTSLWELGRFLDGQDVADIEFEAELCGMADLLRKLKRGANA